MTWVTTPPIQTLSFKRNLICLLLLLLLIPSPSLSKHHLLPPLQALLSLPQIVNEWLTSTVGFQNILRILLIPLQLLLLLHLLYLLPISLRPLLHFHFTIILLLSLASTLDGLEGQIISASMIVLCIITTKRKEISSLKRKNMIKPVNNIRWRWCLSQMMVVYIANDLPVISIWIN